MRPAAVTASLGALLTLAAATFDAEPLYVPGIALVALAGGAVAWVLLAAHGLRVERAVGARSVAEGEPVAITITVRAGAVAPPTGAVRDELLPAMTPLASGRRTTTVRIDVRFARRGRRLLAPPSVVVCDPFGLAVREVRATEAAEVLVLPRVLAVHAAGTGGEGEGVSLRRGRPRVAAEIDLDGLRPHRPGSPASRIVWPAYARTGELTERRLRADSDTRPLVVLDPRAAATPEDLDDAVRAVASLTVHLARAGGCALLLPGDRRPAVVESTLGGWDRLHVRLALVGAGGAPHAGALGTRRGPVLYVCAQRGARPPRALLAAPGGGRLLVVPGVLEGRRAAFTVAGCTGYELSVPRLMGEVA